MTDPRPPREEPRKHDFRLAPHLSSMTRFNGLLVWARVGAKWTSRKQPFTGRKPRFGPTPEEELVYLIDGEDVLLDRRQPVVAKSWNEMKTRIVADTIRAIQRDARKRFTLSCYLPDVFEYDESRRLYKVSNRPAPTPEFTYCSICNCYERPEWHDPVWRTDPERKLDRFHLKYDIPFDPRYPTHPIEEHIRTYLGVAPTETFRSEL